MVQKGLPGHWTPGQHHHPCRRVDGVASLMKQTKKPAKWTPSSRRRPSKFQWAEYERGQAQRERDLTTEMAKRTPCSTCGKLTHPRYLRFGVCSYCPPPRGG